MNINKKIEDIKTKVRNTAIGAMAFAATMSSMNASAASEVPDDNASNLKKYKEFVNYIKTENPAFHEEINQNKDRYLLAFIKFANADEASMQNYKEFVDNIKKSNPKMHQDITANADSYVIGFETFVKMSKDAQKEQNNNIKSSYDYGNTTISFAFAEDGSIRKLNVIGQTSPNANQEAIKEINESIARQKQVAVDRDAANLEATQFIYEMQVREAVIKAKNTGNTIPNADAFLKYFDKKVADNGMEINNQGCLQPTKANLTKPLKNQKQLFQEYKENQLKQQADFYSR